MYRDFYCSRDDNNYYINLVKKLSKILGGGNYETLKQPISLAQYY